MIKHKYERALNIKITQEMYDQILERIEKDYPDMEMTVSEYVRVLIRRNLNS